jgi:hypothetical protein
MRKKGARMFDVKTFLAKRKILQGVITSLDASNQLPKPPGTLYHYSSLEVIQKILEMDDVRLSHAQYSNDQTEIIEARSLILQRLAHTKNSFNKAVEEAFLKRADEVDAYIFCMTSGDESRQNPQDLLSQWRAYAQDGRGGALTLDMRGVNQLVYHFPELRINPVLYDPNLQCNFIDSILDSGKALQAANRFSKTVAVAATVESLIFVLPLIKHPGFSEEREWRLIFMPFTGSSPVSPTVKFQPRRDFIAPFLEFRHLWNDIRPEMIKMIDSHFRPPINVQKPNKNRLIPATGLMVGPSTHQQLNIRAMTKAVAQSSRNFSVDASAIPYRSLT